ncbi:DUF1937 family protein [Candidatus Berkiella cookevillensis]|uniref:DUF1937 family protein n=1 Tax=Candidatus Berkiella cookevillensis TaxID=437022 RepID=A0A0Q9YQI4_9GAMM|nr:DUF1937 family protein [Candidatus Berkiella cookevillensis]MCS5708713.1 DUF1937 family protein [Candidatus Berkiella cookevillensis]
MSQNQTMAYLASPYTHEEKNIRDTRYLVTAWMAAQLIRDGIHVFSATNHNAMLENFADLTDRLEDWQRFNHCMIKRCDKVIVLKMPGWEKSKGIQDQIKYAQLHSIPVEMMEVPQTIIDYYRKKVEREPLFLEILDTNMS